LILWLDAQLSPYLARWISDEFGIETHPVRDLGLRDAKDSEIFIAAREAGSVVLTKDSDFVILLEQLGPPPQILWLTIGNTSNAHLREVMMKTFASAWELIQRRESLVEITEPDAAAS
jgi:predicted nuclease of predicted toxin-antitoxin system